MVELLTPSDQSLCPLEDATHALVSTSRAMFCMLWYRRYHPACMYCFNLARRLSPPDSKYRRNGGEYGFWRLHELWEGEREIYSTPLVSRVLQGQRREGGAFENGNVRRIVRACRDAAIPSGFGTRALRNRAARLTREFRVVFGVS